MSPLGCLVGSIANHFDLISKGRKGHLPRVVRTVLRRMLMILRYGANVIIEENNIGLSISIIYSLYQNIFKVINLPKLLFLRGVQTLMQ